MKKNGKRLGAMLLTLVMVLSMVPVTALGAEETTSSNLAQGKTAYASGLDSSDTANGVDGNINTHWSGSQMKTAGAGTATTEKAVSWFVVDLLGDNSGDAVDQITGITMSFDALVWPTECKVQVATENVSYADYTTPSDFTMKKTDDYANTIHAIDNENWTTIATFTKDSGADGAGNTNIVTMSTDYSENVTEDSLVKVKPATKNLDAIPEGVRYVRVYFTGINTNAGGTCIGMKELTVAGTLKPVYTLANVNAGLFDVGATATKGEDGTWTAKYSPTDNGVTITATAPSYANPASNAVDGDTVTNWHSNWANNSGEDQGTGYNQNDLPNHPEARYIQIDLSEETEISALRYLPNFYKQWVNGIVTRYEIKVCSEDTVDDSSTWTTVATANDTTNWDAAFTAAGNPENSNTWFIAYFEPVETKHVRLYGVTTKSDGHTPDSKYMIAREIRLVKAGTLDCSVTGTITDGTDPLEGAKVELVQQEGTSKAFVRSVASATTDENGKYKLDVLNAAAGNYLIRASKEGYGAVIGETTITVTADGVTAGGTNNNATLTAIDVEGAKFAYNMDANTADKINRPTLGFADATTKPTATYENDALVLSFPNTDRMNNLVKLTGTGVKNGTVEFDATRGGTYSNPGRFGLALRLQNSGEWVYVGLNNNDSTWFHEWWNDGGNNWSGDTSGPVFGKGDTRHFKVTIQDNTVTLVIDGITVLNGATIGDGSSNGKSAPTSAADVGFICGNNGYGVPSTVTIDNLYIFREDPTFTVTLGDNLSAKISSSAGDEELGGNGGDQAAEGDVIKVTGTSADGKVLDAVTLTKTADSSAVTDVTVTRNADGTFSFSMPKYNVSVSGTFRTVVGDVTIDETNGLKVDKTLTANVAGLSEDDADKVSYQWYHNGGTDASPNWIACTNEGNNTKTKTVSTEDEGKKVKVVVTGKADNGTYATTVSKEAVSTAAMAAADVGVGSVSLNKSGTVNMNKGDSLDDVVATLTSAVTGKDYTTPVTISWASSATGVATVTAKADDNKQATVTAVADGDATITVTVTDALGEEKTDSFAVKVTTKVTTITVSAPDGKDNTIYFNDDDDKTLQLTAAVNSDATVKTVGWTTSNASVATVSDTGLVSAVGVGSATITATADDSSGVTGTYEVTVKGKLKGTVTITIPAAGLKNGNTLTASTTNVTPADVTKTYKWYRDNDTTPISGATGSTYTLTDDDVNHTIKVEVGTSATGYEGTVTSDPTDAVGKKAGPAAPTGLVGTDCTSGNNGEISGLTAGTSYEYSTDGGSSWSDATVTDGKITGLAAGTYYIRVKVANKEVQEEGASSTGIVILAEGATAHSITEFTSDNGTVTASKNKADEEDEITLTVAPADGYQLVSGSLKVYKTGDEDTEVTVENNKFNMPGYDVTITAQFEAKTYTVNHELGENVSCDYGTDTEHKITHATTITIQLSVPTGYELPASITVTEEGDTTWHGYEYNSSTGLITINGANVVNNLTVTCAAAQKKVLAITDNLGSRLQCDLTEDQHKVTYGEDKTINLSFRDSTQTTHHMPATITVTMDGQPMKLDPAANESGYTYVVAADGLTAVLTLKKVTAPVTVSATAEQNKTAIEGVTITFSHHVDGVEGSAPHAGDTLNAEVDPSTASVNYQWKRTKDGTTTTVGTNAATYTLTDDDVDGTITVTVTGTGDYEGEETSAATGAVKAAYVVPTGITLDQTTATVEFRKTLTLTATVAPTNATDKTVNWTSSDETVATVANGVVTPVKVGTATITATNSEGHNVTCTVTVTAAQVGVTLAGVAKVGRTLTATLDPSDATYRSINWYKVDDSDAATGLDNTGLTYTLTAADVGYKIRVGVDATGNYTGNSATTADTVVGENVELPTHTITITASENGTVTADKEAASAGEVVTLTATPATGYELGTLTVTGASSAPVTVAADNTFVMPGENVTVTATFTESSGGEEPPVVVTPTGVSLDKTEASVNVGSTVQLTATLDPSNATAELEWTSSDDAIATVDQTGTVTGVAESEDPVTITVTVKGHALTATCEVTVTKVVTSGGSVGKQPTTTTTTNNPDGSTTVTETKPDGTKVATTEKPDGTKETVETKKDGTVTETTESPDGTKEVVETKPDGTKTETVETPDGAKEIVETKPDGTVTETAIDPEGAKTEKVTDPEENVTITVTDAEGEELVKVELPASIPAPETKFEDVPEDHWAENAINTVAGLGLVKGVENDRYDMVTPMDRGSLATILYRLSNGKSDYAVSFADVAEGKYYTEGVAWAAKVGVVTGISKDIFAPEQVITREQLAVMLARYAKLLGMDTKAETTSLDTFADSDKTGTWAVDSVAWCIEKGILRGKGGNVLDPAADVTRAEVAVMLERFIGLMK